MSKKYSPVYAEVIELDNPPKVRKNLFPRIAATLVIVSLIIGGLIGYFVANATFIQKTNDLESSITSLQNSASNLQNQVSGLRQNISSLQASNEQVSQNLTSKINGLQNALLTLQNSTSIFVAKTMNVSTLYNQVKNSVVIIRGTTIEYDVFLQPYFVEIEGSGFAYNSSGRLVIITNNHVVQTTQNLTVTFIDGNGYPATVLGTDAFADLGVISVNCSPTEFNPLNITDSSTLNVGDPVVAVGNPYGLAGSITSGIVSALGRTIQETEIITTISIPNCIQTSAPINPGNSGGPLLNEQGDVVGITTAAVTNSQGLGFAIPSSTILREVNSLVQNGSYNKHPWLGATGIDMDEYIAQAMNTNITYGVMITQIDSFGPAYYAGLQAGTQDVTIFGSTVTIGGDIIVAINGTRIVGGDQLSAFLDQYTLPNQDINVTILRNNQTTTLSLEVGTQPPI
jgi:S1-C subfamily serine protease